MDREEFERLLQVANQRKVESQKEEENESISHHDALFPCSKEKARTGHHMANSTELPGHDNSNTLISKTKS